jgi:hypothetical protein
MIEKQKKKRILRFTTYYKLLKPRDKSQIKSIICDKCEFKGSTFYYKLNNLNYSGLEIEIIETIVNNYKYAQKL